MFATSRRDLLIASSAIGAGLGAALFPAPAQAGALVTGPTTAQVLEEIQFAVLLDMNFGRIAVNGAGGVVELDPASNNRMCDAGLVCTGTFAVSQLHLTGSDANVQINFQPSFTLTGPGDPMLVEPQFPGGPGAVINLTGGARTVRFGARLHINPLQAPGVYSGDFSIDLEYN